MAYSQPPILADVLAVKPPSSPVSQSDYWSATFTAAWRKVRDLCRRNLVTASYTDHIRTFPQPVGDVGDPLHVAYLREPITHGGTLTISAITLGGTTVDAADYQAYHDRIVMESPGEVVVTYAGGYATTDAEWVVVLLAIHDAMVVMHNQRELGGADSFSSGGVSRSMPDAVDAYRNVLSLLGPVRVQILSPGYEGAPEDVT